MSDDREGFEDMQADMSAHQREHAHVEPTGENNRKLAADLFERLDREQADALPDPIRSPAPPPPPEPKTERKEIDGKGYLVDSGGSPDVAMRPATETEHHLRIRMQPRIDLLLSKPESGPLGQPSWRDRTLSMMYWGVKLDEARRALRFDLVLEYQARYEFERDTLLEESSAVFGDWRALPTPKVMVG